MNGTELLSGFWPYAEEKGIELYNEFSLQHEIGIYLREKLPGRKVQFERNVAYFGIRDELVKKEIDVSVFTPDHSETYALELKFPRNGQYPEQMYSFVRDLVFAEELVQSGFTGAWVLTLAEDRPFFEGARNEGIYRYFRGGEPLEGTVFKPTGPTKGREALTLSGSYRIAWQKAGARRWYCLEAKP